MNTAILEKFQTENGLVVTNKKALNAYIQSKKENNEAIDVDDLKAHINEQGTDRFKVDETKTHTDRPEDIKNREDLIKKIELLSIDATQKEELKQAIQKFYDERSIKNKPNLNEFSLKTENGLLIIKSHNGNETQIDINSKTLKTKNNNDITFSTLSEALNIADLTNHILGLTIKKTPSNSPIFLYHRLPQKAICFNDNSGRLNTFDTAILNINRIRNCGTIDKDPDTYANYLSERREEINKLNLTNYPLVKQLGIDFYLNEEEIKKLETYLQGIKEKLKVFEGHPDGNPFSIEVLTNKLRFKTINGDMEHFPENISKEFPTLTWRGNKKAFLKAINDPNNKMRGTALSN